jgi:hypothetical protein
VRVADWLWLCVTEDDCVIDGVIDCDKLCDCDAELVADPVGDAELVSELVEERVCVGLCDWLRLCVCVALSDWLGDLVEDWLTVVVCVTLKDWLGVRVSLDDPVPVALSVLVVVPLAVIEADCVMLGVARCDED